VLYVEDACDILLRAAQEKRLVGESYFAVHEQHLSVIAIAQEIIRVLGRGTLTHIEWPEERQRIEIDRVEISGQRLRDVTDWSPRYSFEQGLLKTKAILERK
jgi:nucleoside-diphosphate-sugar epimerase